jgi:CRP-like cAMP-binding protein
MSQIHKALEQFQANSKLLSLLDRDALEGLAESARIVHVKSGERIVSEGEVDDEFFLVASGEVEVIMGSGSGSTQEIARLGAGHFFGEIGAIMHEPRSASVEALCETKLIGLTREPLLALMGEYTHLRDVLAGVGLKRTEQNFERMLKSIDDDESSK